jgi:hypothetical protein
MNLTIGDKFTNTQGNKTTVVNIHSSGKRCTLLSETGTRWHEDTSEIKRRIVQKVYKSYYPNTNTNISLPLEEFCYYVGFDKNRWHDYINILRIFNIKMPRVYNGNGTYYGFRKHTGMDCRKNPWCKNILDTPKELTEFLNTIYNIKTKNKDEKTSKITTNRKSKGSKAITKQVGSRRVTIASPLIGNSIPASPIRRQIREIEILCVSVSARHYAMSR